MIYSARNGPLSPSALYCPHRVSAKGESENRAALRNGNAVAALGSLTVELLPGEGSEPLAVKRVVLEGKEE